MFYKYKNIAHILTRLTFIKFVFKDSSVNLKLSGLNKIHVLPPCYYSDITVSLIYLVLFIILPPHL
jgi:hypothetical protein